MQVQLISGARVLKFGLSLIPDSKTIEGFLVT